MIEPGSDKKGLRIVLPRLIWQKLLILRTKAVITSFPRNSYQSNSKTKKYQVVKKIKRFESKKFKSIRCPSYLTSLQGLSLYVFTSLINRAFSCQSFNSAPLWIPRSTPITLLRSGNESFIKVGAKNHQKKHQNHPGRYIGQYYVLNWRKGK